MNKNMQEKLRQHYNSLASERHDWCRKSSYFHDDILKYYRFLVQENSSILELGCGTGDIIGSLSPSYGVGVDISEDMLNVARERFPDIEFVCSDIESFFVKKKFDYIIISGTLSSVENIQALFQSISRMCTSDTRVIVECYNQLWNPILKLSEKLGLKMPEVVFNWLSIDDVENFFDISGYQVVKHEFRQLFPKYIPVLSTFLNRFVGRLPFIRRLCVEEFVIARLQVPPENAEELTTSVVITCRDEEGNIEGLVERIPQMGMNTEILFVEGHSKDKTVEKINEMIAKHPDKDVKILKQKGIGQGDAFRLGFDKAEGDFVFWLEADLTTPPEEIGLFWQAYIEGRGEYINGSRFVYKMEEKAMPFLNFVGNRFFGNLFTLLLGQRFTDTLCGYKGISKRNYLKIRKEIEFFGDFDPFGDFELIFGAVKNNLKVAEIPVHYRPRGYGQSKAYGQSILSFFSHGMLLLRMSWIAFKKFRLY